MHFVSWSPVFCCHPVRVCPTTPSAMAFRMAEVRLLHQHDGVVFRLAERPCDPNKTVVYHVLFIFTCPLHFPTMKGLRCTPKIRQFKKWFWGGPTLPFHSAKKKSFYIPFQNIVYWGGPLFQNIVYWGGPPPQIIPIKRQVGPPPPKSKGHIFTTKWPN